MKIVKIAIMAAVAVILLGSLLVPIINGYSDDTKQVKNNGGAMSQVLDPAGVEITFDPSTRQITKNGEDLYILTGTVPLVMTDQFIVIGSVSAGDVAVSGPDGKTASISDTITVTMSGGTATVTYGETTREFTGYTWGFVVDPNGDFGAFSNKAGATTVYFNTIDQIYGANWLDTTSEWFSFNGTKVKVSGDDVTATYTEHTTSAADMFYTTIGGGNTAEYSFVVDNNGSDYTVHPRFFIVPQTVSGHTEQELQFLSMLYVIPLFVIVAMVITIAAVFRRDN